MTGRIRFRELNKKDVHKLFEIYSDKEAMKYRGSKPMETIEDAKRFVENKRIEDKKELTIRKGVELIETNELIGSVMFRFHKDRKHACEIGYSIGRNYWGQGLGEEIVRAMLKTIVEKKAIKEIIAWSHKENTASIKLLIKIGFQLIKQEANHNNLFFRKVIKRE